MAAAAYKMLSVAEATEVALAHTPTLPPATATLADCLGRVLAEDVKAPEPLPPFPASMKVTPPGASRASSTAQCAAAAARR